MTKKLTPDYVTADRFADFSKRFPAAKLINAMTSEQQDAIFAQAARWKEITG